jgi:hypothetical protein
LIPKDNLFKIFNEDGEGVLPAKIIEAISAVIEPLGFEVEKVLVPDEELRQGLGYEDRVCDITRVTEFHGKDGIGMINIREGYSHAFYWEKMDSKKFGKEEFRMAMMITRNEEKEYCSPSVIAGLLDYCQMVQDFVDGKKRIETTFSDPVLHQLEGEIISLSRYLSDVDSSVAEDFRQDVDEKLVIIQSLVNYETILRNGDEVTQMRRALLETGERIREIWRQSREIK